MKMFINKEFLYLRTYIRKKIKRWSPNYCNCIRAKSSMQQSTKTYSHTILTPKTNFPSRANNAKKQEIAKTAQFSELYDWQRKHLTGSEFILHDGPPYANGDLHMGHAVNKIIKDINNRSQVLQGKKVHYVPGWDCHGLPIELKALHKAKKKIKDSEPTSPVAIRKIARDFALETVENQKSAFKSWGVMADWEKQCYMTLNKSYTQKQLKQFYKMYGSGLIFRALKPVYWSPSSRTALAEAELEYDPLHKSTEAYVIFPIEKPPQIIQDVLSGHRLSAIIWTTTPWTLMANRAICYSPQLKYSLVTLSNKPGEYFLVGSGLIEGLDKILGVEITKRIEFDGKHLKDTTYKNKLINEVLPFLEGDHVTESKGTGLVHTAPAHGPEDFLVALKNNMPVKCNVDEEGCYIDLDPELNGLSVLKAGQDIVISRLGDAVIFKGVYIHSYPLDWRTKQPVIVRASQQWFIDTAALKEKALEALDKVTILPPSSADQSRQGFRAQLEKRPYWCISRQRAWGVPIPALYCGQDVIVDERVIERLNSLIEEEGPDVWWTCDVKQLLSDDLVKEYQLQDKEVIKGQDIMDIWLDSGLSWQILDSDVAQMYAEGVDQLTGWFQASLLTSLALKGHAPYKSIFVHGFVVDDKRRKMSKSIGNVIDPTTIIEGGRDKKVQPAYGVDTLRWWVASHATQHSQIVISKKLLDDCFNEVIRIRNIIKYLLGIVSDLEKEHFDRNQVDNYFDQLMVQESCNFLKQINEHYNNFRYNHVAQTILFYISNKVSGLYCHCIKDRLYCSPKYSEERISAQLVVHTILVSLLKSLGPILPHLIEEAWQYHPLYEKPFYFTLNLPVLLQKPVNTEIMVTILDIKRDICLLAKNEDLKKYSVKLMLDSNIFDELSAVGDNELCEIFELSAISLEKIKDGGDKWRIEMSQSKNSRCLRCRKYTALKNSDICLRCEKTVALV